MKKHTLSILYVYFVEDVIHFEKKHFSILMTTNSPQEERTWWYNMKNFEYCIIYNILTFIHTDSEDIYIIYLVRLTQQL